MKMTLLLILSLFCAGDSFAQIYSTNFDGTENPLSEGGVWSHFGQNWTVAQKVDGVAFGTQSGEGGYDDSYAYLSGFPADQSASGVIRRVSGDGGIHELEILLRWSDSAHSAQGYECNLSYDGSYAQIVRWNGPFGDFTYIGWAAQAPVPHSGDTFSATVTGDLIIAYYNGAEIMRAADATYLSGNPGVGFFIQSNQANGDLGFTGFTAIGLGESDVDLPVPPGFSGRLRLSQNQPNPFSRETVFEYGLPSPGPVSLTLYDPLGREAATVVDTWKPAGSNLIRFDGSTLEGGAYIARLKAGARTETRKILIVN